MTMTIGQFLDAAVADRPEKAFLYFEERAYTYRAMRDEANRVAHACLAHGIERGDRVAVILPNCPEFLFIWFGLAKIGAVLAPLNPTSTRPEVAAYFRRSDPKLIVVDGAQVAVAREALSDLGQSTPVVDVTELPADDTAPPADQGVSNDDVSVLIQTSGTTGVPKLVMQTHRAYVLAGEGFPWWMGANEDDRFMTSLPLFHINAQAYSTMGALAGGASLILLPRFSASQFWAQARRYGATMANMIGAMLEILMRQPERPEEREHSLRLIYTAPLPPEERHLEMERRFGVRLTAGYALSESPYGAVWPLDDPRPYGSMGRPRQHPTLGIINEARVVDDAGNDLPPGQPGELLLRNPAVMKGYFRLPEETAKTLEGGWLHTGDLVRQTEDGLLYFIARKKEVIRRRGENLAPIEVEAVLNEHPGVQMSAVVGVPSDLSEEDVKAFVVPTPGTQAIADELWAWCAERLARYKVPRYIEFVPELPLTSTARIAKHRLPRERTPSEHDRERQG